MAEKQKAVETLFMAALEIQSDIERKKFLEEKCGGDINLKDQVESLLAANSEMSEFLQGTTPFWNDTKPEGKAIEAPGDWIGAYHLIAPIGEGGMGQVYVAQQEKPVKRKVALKLIKAGMDSKEVLARFDAERQALAMMEHPNIAKVLDAGQTDSGRPYFVMELVEGTSVTDYCDRRRLSTNERLHLFLDICSAVQHAHQKGIIHRDLKPSNVLVAVHGDKAVAKVIDFGVAKAIDQRLTDHTLQTQQSQMVGTPLYMSPEQADFGTNDIDTRSDIYSLGVLLYELLTGQTPFDKARLREAGFDEMRRILREEDPQRPSTRLKNSHLDLDSISRARNTDPTRLQNSLHGDLDWIVMKALDKERSRRYETANGLAMDVQRHLREEPVVACPPTVMYRVHKFFRRNRTGVIAASVVAAAILIGLIGSGSGLIWALNEKSRADEAAKIAITKEKTSRTIVDFFVGLFNEASPKKRLGKPMTVSEFLDVGADQLGDLADDEPETLAKLQETVGTLYVVLSEYDKAEPLLDAAYEYRQARAENSPEDELAFASVMSSLAGLHQWEDHFKAEEYAQAATDIYERLMGDSPELADSLNVLGNSLQRQDRLEDSLVAFYQSLAIREKLWPPGHAKHAHVATPLHNIGITHFFNRDLGKAEEYYLRAIEIEEDYLPEDDFGMATSKHVLSIVYANQSKFENARKWQQEAFDVRTKVFPADHDHVALSNNWLGNILRELRMYAQSEPMLRRAVEIHDQVYGSDHPLVFWDKLCLLRALIKLEKFDEATQLQQELISSIGEGDRFTNSRILTVLESDMQLMQGEMGQAKSTLQDLIKDHSTPEKMARSIAVAKLKLCAIDIALGSEFNRTQHDSAVKYLIDIEKWPDNDPQLLQLQTEIADALYEANKSTEATELYEAIKDGYSRLVEGPNVDPYILDLAARFFLNCRDTGVQDSKRGLELAKLANRNVAKPSAHYKHTLALAQKSSNDRELAVATMRSAIELLPDDSIWLGPFKDELAQLNQ